MLISKISIRVAIMQIGALHSTIYNVSIFVIFSSSHTVKYKEKQQQSGYNAD